MRAEQDLIRAVVILVCCVWSVSSAQISFLPPGSERPMQWAVPENWDLGRTPQPEDDVVIPAHPAVTYSVLLGHYSGTDLIQLRTLTVGGGAGAGYNTTVYLDVNGQLAVSNGITVALSGNLNLRATNANNNVTMSYMAVTTLLYVSEGATLAAGEGAILVSDRLEVHGRFALRRDTTQLVELLTYRKQLPRSTFTALAVTQLEGDYVQSSTGEFAPWIASITTFDVDLYLELPGESAQFQVLGHVNANGTLAPVGIDDIESNLVSVSRPFENERMAQVITWLSRAGVPFQRILPPTGEGPCTPFNCETLPCSSCADSAPCLLSTQCLSNMCDVTSGQCVDPCHDGLHNFEETDVDCGGDLCVPCSAKQACSQKTDCWNSVPGQPTPNFLDCVDGLCVGCGDGLLNFNETGVDCGAECGGSLCLAGEPCHTDADCLNGDCLSNTNLCASCTDGVQNFGETSVDCGGLNCPPCVLGQGCISHSDCNQSITYAHVVGGEGTLFVPLHCDLNGTFLCTLIDEDCYVDGSLADTPCGQNCIPCQDGEPCSEDADCLRYRETVYCRFECGSAPDISGNSPPAFLASCSTVNNGGLSILFTSSVCEPACPFGWGGNQCDVPLCNPIAADYYGGSDVNLIDNCNGNGECSASEDPPVCLCAEGWRGADCLTLDCPGSPDCSGKGACVLGSVSGVAECQCDSDWDGADCSVPVCAEDCNGRGSCSGESGTPQCVCTVPGWEGPTCSSLACPQAGGQVCNGHGRCARHTDGVRGGQCTCESGWSGSACEQFSCPGSPQCNAPHGVCILRGGVPECDCALGYSGSACTTTTSSSPDPPAELCPVNQVSGFRCSTLPCDEAAGLCECAPFFSGDACEVAVCGADFLRSEAAIFRLMLALDYDLFDEAVWRAQAAALMGVSETRVCVLSKWRGSVGLEVAVAPSMSGSNDAQQAVDQVFGALSNDSNDPALRNVTSAQRVVIGPSNDPCLHDCSLHGSCVSGGECECDLGWTGEDCSVLDCPGTPNCFERGVCDGEVFPPACVCYEGFSGEDCGEGVCPYNCSYPQGECDAMAELPVCVCEPGFDGEYCQEDLSAGSGSWTTLDWASMSLLIGALVLVVVVVLFYFTCRPLRRVIMGKEGARVDNLRNTRKLVTSRDGTCEQSMLTEHEDSHSPEHSLVSLAER